ncbi:GPW/gp25 family protein [Shinella kummerowiae]|uniref:GPW/gp25 family protein n=1 Tax=Shinella kummerowiae TaxID=417745 RepID=UPI0021B56458|nr:baseplate assembly protein [Shinella kummerowiae]MCT7668209.1 baseplate assembly protein [Shinella kummerowiae]
MRTGVDARTGKVLTGWDHCVQSIGRCLTTRIASRVQRRHLGCLVPELQDDNADPLTIMKAYVSIADALNDEKGGEPGFNLTSIDLVRGGRDGRFVFLMDGDHYPNGHLGDWSVSEPRTASWGRSS